MASAPFFRIINDALRGARRTGTQSSDQESSADITDHHRRVLIVGTPNVGKSVLFNALTGRYVVVSNYPGTTVEVSRGRMRIDGTTWEVVDTPGMYSLRPLSDEERVARAILLEEDADVLLHVVDAKNLDRMLAFTLQLVEANLPVILVVNLLDEARRLGLAVDLCEIQRALAIPVLGTVALTGQGVDELREAINGYHFADAALPILTGR
jgi:ferrous iron transport protein B